MLNDLCVSYYPSPIGVLKITFTAEGLKEIDFIEGKEFYHKNSLNFEEKGAKDTFNLIYDQLNEYFTGKRFDFALPLLLEGTDFQKKVWMELVKIPYGEKRAYGQIAAAIGKKRAARAVGNANHSNPLPIIVPCHRVIGVNGKLTGYAGGLWRKKWLIDHELLRMKKYKGLVANDLLIE